MDGHRTLHMFILFIDSDEIIEELSVIQVNVISLQIGMYVMPIPARIVATGGYVIIWTTCTL